MADSEQLRLAGRWDEALDALRREQGELLLRRARILYERSIFGDVDGGVEADEVLAEADALAAATGDLSLLAGAQDLRGLMLHAQFLADRSAGEPPGELEAFERALALRRESGDERGIAESLFHVGLVHQVVRGDAPTAEPYFDESYRRARELEDGVLASYAVRHLAWCRQERGDMEGARAGFEESLGLREETGFVPGVGAALLALGRFEAEAGRPEVARELLESARTLLEQLGSMRFLGFVDDALAELDAGGS